MAVKLRAGRVFQLKNEQAKVALDFDFNGAKCVIPLSLFKAGEEDLKKRGKVCRGDLLLDGEKILLAPVCGELKVVDENIIIDIGSCSGCSETCADISFLQKGNVCENLVKLGLLPKKNFSELKQIVISFASTEPYNMGEDLLLKLFGNDFEQKLSVIKDLFPGKKIVLAYSNLTTKNKFHNIKNLDFISIPKRYPMDNEKIIMARLEICNPSSLDMSKHLMLQASYIEQIYQFVKNSVPPTESFVAVAGNIQKPFYANLPHFISLKDVLNKICQIEELKQEDFVVSSGGVFTSKNLNMEYLIPFTNSLTLLNRNKARKLWAFMHPGCTSDSASKTFLSSFLPIKKTTDNYVHGERRACVFCGYCVDICPVGILPFLLFKNTEIDELEDAKHLQIMDCVDCGLCTYVCPSKIPIADIIANGKDIITRENI